MAKTIKRNVEMNLWELIKWARETKRFGEYYDINHRGVRIKQDALEFLSYNSSIWVDSDTFTTEIEEEITEETVFNEVMVVFANHRSDHHKKMSINQLIENYKSACGFDHPMKFIYLQNDDGSIGDLIWERENGLVE